MVAERLARHHTPVTTIDELWYRVEAAWSSVPVHAIQSLFDSMPRHISYVITARGSVGASGSGRCHLHEDQSQDAFDRPVIEKKHHIVRNARGQPTASSAAIQALVAPSLGAPVSSRIIRRRLAEGHLKSRRTLRVLDAHPLTPPIEVMLRTRKLDCGEMEPGCL
ncbi:HTH_Tnp_Tc3_2 domain-containing protein [Trichonephila clavipes]|nr:HTH_Tnp_Tc3_2 domain-containing protein [Trichonephila clavipes]